MTPAEKAVFDAMREALQKFTEYEKATNERDDVYGMILYAEFSDMCNIVLDSLDALDAADAVAEQGQALQRLAQLGQEIEAAPMSREHWLAIREGHFNAAAEQYFTARPQLDTAAQRRIFYAGHCAGYGEPPAETDAERMAGARAKHDDTYPGDLLARMEDDPR